MQTYLQYSYDGEFFYRNGSKVDEGLEKEIPTYIRLVLKDMNGDPIPPCFTPIKGGQG